MNTKEKVLDDVARMAGGAVNALSGVTSNIREDLKARLDEVAERLDLIPREEFERLELRVAALEKQLEEKTKKPKKKS